VKGFTTTGSAGLGLSMIKTMIEVYNWSMQETGEVGKSTKFEVTIPVIVAKFADNAS
jgi:signal transduction histidine kinase